MIEIKTYTPAQEAVWNEFVASCTTATFLHKRSYMDYHSHRFTDHSLMAYADGRLLAVMPANVANGTLYSHQGLTYGGWLHQLKHFDATVMMDVMQNALVFLKNEGLEEVIYKPVPHIYHRYPSEEDLYALFRAGAILTESNISTAVQLSNPLAFDRGNKRSVNVAIKANVQVAESTDWNGFWHVLEEVLAQRHATKPVHSVEEIKLLHSRFPEQIKLYTASIHQRIVAGVVMFYTHTVAHSQYIASNAEGRDAKALALLFRHLIDQAKANGYAYFDFGISNEDHGRWLNEGLVQQKSRLGGRGIVYNTYKITL